MIVRDLDLRLEALAHTVGVIPLGTRPMSGDSGERIKDSDRRAGHLGCLEVVRAVGEVMTMTCPTVRLGWEVKPRNRLSTIAQR